MNDSILIRAFQPRDLPEMARLFDSYRQFYKQGADLVRAERFIRARTENADSAIVMAEGDGS